MQYVLKCKNTIFAEHVDEEMGGQHRLDISVIFTNLYLIFFSSGFKSEKTHKISRYPGISDQTITNCICLFVNLSFGNKTFTRFPNNRPRLNCLPTNVHTVKTVYFVCAAISVLILKSLAEKSRL